ncbi:MAG: tetratricopeptide repeat protein [Beutenbergiaceae bacterium]
MTTAACREPGCVGSYEDGWCNVCGSRASTPAPNASASASEPAVQRGSTRTSSARLASAAIGSARVGTRATRRLGTGSTRLRSHRLGAGLTMVPPTPVADPLQAVMAQAQVPERKRFCSSCSGPVGRTHEGVPGRTSGFCPACGAAYDFDPTLQPGDVVAGQYEVVGALAHGGLGWIYLARDRNVSGRWVVLKGLLNSDDPDAVEAAIAERQFLAEVEHPLIVEIYNFVTHHGAGYTVMEYVGGTSLKQILKERQAQNGGAINPLPVDQALAYVLEVLPAFSYLHDRDLVYCDFKPDNIIQSGGTVKLIDLGGVRRIDDTSSAIFGTKGYQAPEVGEALPTPASDIYTIGRTLATLVLNFRGNTSTYVSSLPPVDQTPLFGKYDSFYRLLAKACALDPDDRFASIDELRVQLLGVLREVVAIDKGGQQAAVSAVTSPLFEAPTVDVPERPLRWNELPRLMVDPGDPMVSFLAGVNVADPVDRLTILGTAPERSIEVELARANAALSARQIPLVRNIAAEILKKDPWEWRALWVGGLAALASEDADAAVAAFNATYGQVPGELAPKLALATACELAGEWQVAESLYLNCARTDANYTAPAAFGLARIRRHRGEVDGALAALDLVAPTRSSYPAARLQRAQALVSSAGGIPALADAFQSLDGIAVDPAAAADLRIRIWDAALAQVHGVWPVQGAAGTIGGVQVLERPLRDAIEAAYRDRAKLAENRDERLELIARANAVRNWSMW